MTGEYYLPSKISTYLKRLKIEYERSGNALFAQVISASKVFVREGVAYDNWNGGTHGHDVLFFLPAEILRTIPLGEQEPYGAKIQNDLNSCARPVENEFFSSVTFEFEDENDPDFQQAVSVSARPEINPESLAIWGPGHIRLFISHRDVHKVAAKDLAIALSGYGISAFVAHDTIEPMTTWQSEILKGLETMEVLLAFITDDFHDSTWVNQEIGFALGRNVPIIPLKLQKLDPQGFFGDLQALKWKLEDVAASAPKIYDVLAEKLGNKGRLQDGLIAAFVQSPDFDQTKVRFDRLNAVCKSLSEEEVDQIIDGFQRNSQLYNAGHLTSKYRRLANFLRQRTGKEYVIEGRQISPVLEKVADEDPF